MLIKIDFENVIQTIQAGGKELRAHLKAVQHYPLGLIKVNEVASSHPVTSFNPRPVLLLHGVIHNRSAFLSLKKQMRSWGWSNIFTLNYSTRHGSLTGMVEDLALKIEQIQKKTCCKEIDVIAHSLGGLVARQYMCSSLSAGHINTLLTLGTAHQGTSASSFLKLFLSGTLAKDLRRESFYIKALNKTPIPKGSRIISVYSKKDWTVWPTNSAHVESERAVNIELDHVGHVGLLYDSRVFSVIKNQIGRKTPTHLSM